MRRDPGIGPSNPGPGGLPSGGVWLAASETMLVCAGKFMVAPSGSVAERAGIDGCEAAAPGWGLDE